ncbi:MAG: DUF4848 domain-containing protein [Bacteroidota bacterium]|nr:DUF4848 domain-containing protein [Bacteroidota bacterium]
MKRLMYLIIIISVTISYFESCKKSSPRNSSGDMPKTGYRGITVYQDILQFDNRTTFNKTLDSLCFLSDSERIVWEDGLPGFKSMRVKFIDIIDAEYALARQLDTVESDTTVVQHTTLASSNQYMLRTLSMGDGTNYYDMNIHISEYSYITNPYGIVIVNDTIYQYTANLKKMQTTGDKTKITTLISATQTDAINHIIVEVIDPNHPLAKNITSNKNTSSGSFSYSQKGNDGGFRLLSYENFWVESAAGGNKVSKYRIRNKSLQRRVGGAWYDNWKAYHTMSSNFSGNTVFDLDQQNTVNASANWDLGSLTNYTTDEYIDWPFRTFSSNSRTYIRTSPNTPVSLSHTSVTARITKYYNGWNSRQVDIVFSY